jgi:hypothetical protein
MKKLSFFIISLSILSLTSLQVARSQSANIGNITSLKVQNETIYVAGQKGIAALKPDLSVIWEKTLPDATMRLITIDNSNIAWTSYVYVGAESKLLSAFASAWDKLTLSDNTVGLLDLNGTELWKTSVGCISKLSPPAIGNTLVVVNSNDSTLIFDKAKGTLLKSVASNTKLPFGLGKSLMAHNTPNQPLISAEAIFSAGILKYCKFDFQGKSIEDKTKYCVMTTAPLEFKNQIIAAISPYGQRGTKDGVARLFSVNSEMKEQWNEFVDKGGQTGVASIVANKNYIFAASNYDVMAFNEKGKDIWEYDKIGMNALRGVRYNGNVAYKTSNANFMLADDNNVYITSSSKIEKKVFKENITVLDANTGKFVKKTDIEGVIVEIAMLNNKIVVVTEDNKIALIDK